MSVHRHLLPLATAQPTSTYTPLFSLLLTERSSGGGRVGWGGHGDEGPRDERRSLRCPLELHLLQPPRRRRQRPPRLLLQGAGVRSFVSHASQRVPIESHEVERVNNQSKQLSDDLSIPITTSQNDQLMNLKLKLEREGIYFHSIIPGQYLRMLCPKCGGGESKLRSFSLFVREDLELAMWQCFGEQCQWRGHVQESMGGLQNVSAIKRASRIKVYELNKKRIRLEPLGEELLSYLHGRGISVNTLERNGVMQRRFKNEIVIAFPYWRNKLLVCCKYRSKIKRFSKEKDTETIFYGIDDVKEAADIIIVEGEMDKLSMEEAGYCNCVSVPHGALRKASKKVPTDEEVRELCSRFRRLQGVLCLVRRSLSTVESFCREFLSVFWSGSCATGSGGCRECCASPGAALVLLRVSFCFLDRSFRYLYSSKACIEQASRIILATDSDPPGQVLAEELAVRLGVERCWRVRWPRKDVSQLYKDANEVLVSLGPEALRSLVEYAEPWLPSGTEVSEKSPLQFPGMHLEHNLVAHVDSN